MLSPDASLVAQSFQNSQCSREKFQETEKTTHETEKTTLEISGLSLLATSSLSPMDCPSSGGTIKQWKRLARGDSVEHKGELVPCKLPEK